MANLHKILSTVPPQWHAIAAHYARVLDTAGVPADKIDHLIQWGLQYQGSGDEGDILSAFRNQAARIGLADETTALAADLGLEARETINSGKFTPEPIQPDDTTQLLADIRRYRQQWPQDYERDSEMQAAELALLSASMGEKPPAQSALPAPVSDADMRLREIRQLRRDDWQAYESNKALQAEELSLIEASLPKSAPVSTGSDGATSSQPAPEGTASNV
jgi:hypothetical protein